MPPTEDLAATLRELRDGQRATNTELQRLTVAVARLEEQFRGAQELQAQRTANRDQRCLAHEARMAATEAEVSNLRTTTTTVAATTTESRRSLSATLTMIGTGIALAGLVFDHFTS